MKLVVIAAAAAVVAFVDAPAFAQEGFYIGGGYSTFQTDIDVLGSFADVNLNAITGRAGYNFNPFMAVEGEIAIGIDEEEFRVNGSGSFPGFAATVGLDNEVGAFAVGRIPVPLFGGVFGRVGFANIALDATGPDASMARGDGSGLAYGGGIQFGLLAFRARAEYTRYETDDRNVDSFGFTGLFQF